MPPAPSPARTGTALLPDVTLAWREHGPGDGRPVLALHGLCSRAATWDHFGRQAAAAGLRTVAVDLRGHGGSSRPGRYSGALMRDDVLALLEQRRLGRVDVVGHSLGGHVAMLLARHAPDRVRRLVLEDTPPPRRTADPTLRGAARRARVLTQALLLASRARTFDVRAVRPVLAEVLVRPDPGWWQALGAVAAPTLLVGGGPPSHVSPAELAEVAAALPDARLVTLTGAGHRVHTMLPDRFAAEVLPFLRG